VNRVSETASNQQTSYMNRVIAASSIGTILEWYDFYLFGTTAALAYFTATFFPGFDPNAAMLAAFSGYAVGFIARPLGGLLFGILGDIYGRKAMLIATVTLMGAGTFAIGLLPGYAVLGIFSTIILVVLRLMQGLSTGGEWGGAALMVVENAPPNRRGFYSSFVQIGVGGGFILATAIFFGVGAVLPPEAMESWGWRIPYLLSIVLLGLGFYIRIKIAETPVFEEVKEERNVERLPILTAFRMHPKEIASATGANLTTSALGSTLYIYGLSYATQQVGFGNQPMLAVLTLTQLFGVAAIIYAGWLSDRIGRKRVFYTGALSIIILAFPFFMLINTGSIVLAAVAFLLMNLFGTWSYAVLAALFSESFDPRVRYTALSVGYQLGGILGAGLAPLILLTLFTWSGTFVSSSLYLIAIAIIGIVSVAFLSVRWSEEDPTKLQPRTSAVQGR
jgi:MHS family shikimate/dehydroshikimate transporter-like MFS transporter